MEYILKTSALIGLFYLCYKLFLQRDTFFKTNRWFLLLGLVISFGFPLIVIPIYITKQITAQFIPFTSTQTGNSSIMVESIDWNQILLYIYALGVIVLSLRFLIQICSLVMLLSRGKSIQKDGFVFIETQKAIAPFSFFNYIVYNPNNFDQKELDQIINHEKIHAIQHHSIDILIGHIATIFSWFNPIIWFYRKDMEQNLEFIADNEVVSQSECSKSYQYILLKSSVPNYQMALTNNFYNSLIKKRIVMLHKNRSKKPINLKPY